MNSTPMPGLLVPHPEAMAAEEPYGDVKYADPGYNDNKKRYPIDNPRHVRAAWAYINMPKNAAKYTAEQLDLIKGRIRAAAKRYGIEIAEARADAGSSAMGMANPYPRAILAGAAPLAPPAAWFNNPNLQAPTKLTITEDGRVFGHLAQWRVCHVGIGNNCVMAPKTQTDYNIFKIGSVVCDDGSQVPIGKIVMGAAHANDKWGVMPARDFYDNTAMTAAVVNIGEDRHGIWISGALTTNMEPEKIAMLRASALSGDWRTVNGNFELIAALAVNSPGFPIINMQGGRVFSMQGVGVIETGDQVPATEINDMTTFSNGTNSITVEQPEQFATPPTGISEDVAERKRRLASIESSRQDIDRQRRFAALTEIDADRESMADDLPITNQDIFQIRSQFDYAKVRELPDEDDEDMDELDDVEDEDE